MFENIDYKIKTFALVNTVVGISASILFGILCFLLGTFLGVVCGLIIMIGGSLLSWASSFALYGFGRLIELTEKNSETNRQLLDIIAHKNKIDLYSESENTWKCDNCGRINYKHTYTCTCGAHKTEQPDKEEEELILYMIYEIKDSFSMY